MPYSFFHLKICIRDIRDSFYMNYKEMPLFSFLFYHPHLNIYVCPQSLILPQSQLPWKLSGSLKGPQGTPKVNSAYAT